jgi:hypothetical protein
MQGRTVWKATSVKATCCLMKPSIASIAPCLGGSIHMTRPLAVYAQCGNVARDPTVPVVKSPHLLRRRPARPKRATRMLLTILTGHVHLPQTDCYRASRGDDCQWVRFQCRLQSAPCLPAYSYNRPPGPSHSRYVAVLALPARNACRPGQPSCGNRASSIDFSNGRRRRLGDPSWCIQQSGTGP